MKPNQLVNQMVNDAKVEPTPKPTIPEKPKAPNPVAEPKAAKPKPTLREQWDSWKRMKDTGSDYSIKKNNRLLNAVAEGIKPYVSPEEHDKWLDDGMAWKGEPQWLDDTEKYLKRIDDNELYNPYKHKRRVARNFDQWAALMDDYDKKYGGKFFDGLDEKRSKILDSALQDMDFKENEKGETIGEFIANNDLVNKYPKDEDYLKAVEPFLKEVGDKYEALNSNQEWTPRDELVELANHYRKFPKHARDDKLEDWEYLNYVQDLMNNGMSATEAYDYADEKFEEYKKNKDQEENMEAYYKSVADRLGVDAEAIKEFVAKNKKQ